MKSKKQRILASIVLYFPKQEVFSNIWAAAIQVDHLLIINNTPGTSIENAMKELPPNATIIQLNKNIGIGAALNLALGYADLNDFQWLLTLDQDSHVRYNHVNKMMSVDSNKENTLSIAQLTPLHKLNDGSIISHASNKRSNKVFCIVKESMTSGSLVNVGIALSVGGFDEALFIDYVDIDFCFRLRKFGYVSVEVDGVVMDHELGNPGPRRRFLWKKNVYIANYPASRVFYQTRNRIIVIKRYFLSEPTYLIQNIVKLPLVPIKILLFETDRLLKLRAFLVGLFYGCVTSATFSASNLSKSALELGDRSLHQGDYLC